jgi:hypothetical protein
VIDRGERHFVAKPLEVVGQGGAKLAVAEERNSHRPSASTTSRAVAAPRVLLLAGHEPPVAHRELAEGLVDD